MNTYALLPHQWTAMRGISVHPAEKSEQQGVQDAEGQGQQESNSFLIELLLAN